MKSCNYISVHLSSCVQQPLILAFTTSPSTPSKLVPDPEGTSCTCWLNCLHTHTSLAGTLGAAGIFSVRKHFPCKPQLGSLTKRSFAYLA